MEESPKIEKYLGKYEIDKEGFVHLGDIARGLLGGQAQYISRFLDGCDPDHSPNLSDSLRVKDVFRDGKPTGNYHDYKIHKDDVEEFVRRVKEFYQR